MRIHSCKIMIRLCWLCIMGQHISELQSYWSDASLCALVLVRSIDISDEIFWSTQIYAIITYSYYLIYSWLYRRPIREKDMLLAYLYGTILRLSSMLTKLAMTSEFSICAYDIANLHERDKLISSLIRTHTHGTHGDSPSEWLIQIYL